MLHHHSTIALLGGSFNPAHAGHLYISLEALKLLGVDAVWWLVSPQNPLKPDTEMADYATRLHKAGEVAAACPHIRVTDIEQRLHSRYSIDTIRTLQHRYPHTRFIWMIGADNLAGLHRWKCWTELCESIPIAVFDRLPYSHSSPRSKAALRYAAARLPERQAPLLAFRPTPCWVYLHVAPHPLSATFLRKKLGKNAFL